MTITKDWGKTDLVKAVAVETGISQTEADRVISEFIKQTVGAVVNGRTVKIAGFIELKPHIRPAQNNYNFQTKSVVESPAKTVVKARVMNSFNKVVANIPV